MSPRRFLRAIKKAGLDVDRKHLLAFSGSLAYYYFLSLLPLLILIASALAYIPIPHLFDQVLLWMAYFVPADSMTLVRKVFSDLMATRNSGFLSFGIVGTIWTASGASAAMNTVVVLLSLGAGYSIFDSGGRSGLLFGAERRAEEILAYRAWCRRGGGIVDSSIVWSGLLPATFWKFEQKLRDTRCCCGSSALVLCEQCSHLDRRGNECRIIRGRSRSTAGQGSGETTGRSRTADSPARMIVPWEFGVDSPPLHSVRDDGVPPGGRVRPHVILWNSLSH